MLLANQIVAFFKSTVSLEQMDEVARFFVWWYKFMNVDLKYFQKLWSKIGATTPVTGL